jgi:hypothetical protein
VAHAAPVVRAWRQTQAAATAALVEEARGPDQHVAHMAPVMNGDDGDGIMTARLDGGYRHGA